MLTDAVIRNKPRIFRYSKKGDIRYCGLCPLWVISGHFAMRNPCPLYPRKRTCAAQLVMSALCQ